MNHEFEEQTFLLRQLQEDSGQTTQAKQLKGRKPSLKVIYTSGYALDLDRTGFILREGLNFLQKPSKAEKIIQAVQDLLGK